MDTMIDLQQLLSRQREIRQAMRKPGGVRILEERELYAISEQLKSLPAAMNAPSIDSTRPPSMR